MSDFIFGALLAVAFGMVSVGSEQLIHGAGLIVGGVLLALWSWLLFGDLPGTADPDEADG